MTSPHPVRGICASGLYLPRRRLERAAIADANTWFDGSLKGLARGRRTMANWDEDTITMAVEACRQALGADDRAALDGLYLASTTLPFADRHNAGVVSEALNLSDAVRTLDIGGVQRAGTSALLAALDAAAGGSSVAVVAAEKRRARVGTASEMMSGDAAAALVVGQENLRAIYRGGVSLVADFIDHYRSSDASFDYGWEERWVRDEGYLKLVPEALSRLVDTTGVALESISHLIVPSPQARVPASLARRLGIDASVLVDNQLEHVGDTGVAHPLLLLAGVLDTAAPGALVAVTGFGQGVDALLFEVTEGRGTASDRHGLQAQIDAGVSDSNYARFQTFNNVVDREFGKRAEMDAPLRPSAHWRSRHTINGFIGGRCRDCGTIQFPKAQYCVNPDCGVPDALDDYPLADVPGRVVTWTADRLTFAMDPPAFFGLVEFDGGARANLDFTEVEPDHFDVGTPVQMRFRIKQFDHQRGFRSYFWKAAPVSGR